MTIFSKRDDQGRSGRADSRKSKPNRLFWMGTSESLRLEPRTMPTLTVTNFPIPLVGLVEPQGITTGSDGNLWFTENGAGRIGCMTPAGVVTSFALPAVPPPAGSPAGTAATTAHPTAIATGPDGALWFTGIPGEIGRITTAGVVTEFALPAVPPPAGSKPGTASTPAMPTSIAAGPDGALWFTGVPGELGRISTAGVVTEFAVPEIPPPAGSSPGTAGTLATLTAITAGPDGALWFTGVPGEVGRITTAGVVTELAVSEGASSTPATLTSITAGPDGALWFTGAPGEVGRITTVGAVTQFAVPEIPPPAGSYPGTVSTPATLTAITAGPDGALWFTGVPGKLGRVTTAGAVSEFAVPGDFDHVAGLTSGPNGNVWFTEQEDGSTRGEQPAVGEITPAGVAKLFALRQGTTLDPSLGVSADPTAITTGPDGELWFGENGAIGRITTAGTIQQFPLPTPTATVEDITPGPDGAVWFVQQVIEANYEPTCSIGRITTTGTITMYPLSNTRSAYVTAGPDGSVWFTETVADPETNDDDAIIGQITAAGQIETFTLPRKVERDASLGNITVGPDGNLWFPFSYDPNPKSGATTLAIGRITAKGSVTVYNVFSTKSYGYYGPPPPSDIISGPDRKLWFMGTVQGTTGIGRISTSGKLAPVIPFGPASNMVRLPNGLVSFETYFSGLGLATRSGIVAIQDLPASSTPIDPNFTSESPGGITIGPDGNLWATSGTSTILRINALDTLAGGLDYRHRPKRAPDYVLSGYIFASPIWTNVSGTAAPTFAGVARPGAEVTLWVQKQGESQPVSIGQVKASKSDGSWTLKSQVKLTNGDFAVTATQTGDTGPPSVLYSLAPDSNGDLPNALVIQARHAAR